MKSWYPKTSFSLTDSILRMYPWENTTPSIYDLTQNGGIAIFNAPFVVQEMVRNEQIELTTWIYYIAQLDSEFKIASISPVHPKKIVSANYWTDISIQPINYPTFDFPSLFHNNSIYSNSILDSHDRFGLCKSTWDDSCWASSSVLDTTFNTNDFPIGYGVSNKELVFINFNTRKIFKLNGAEVDISGMEDDEKIVHSGIVGNTTVILTHRTSSSFFSARFLNQEGLASDSFSLGVAVNSYLYISDPYLIALYKSENKDWAYKVFKYH